LPFLPQVGQTTEAEYAVEINVGGQIEWLRAQPTSVPSEISASVEGDVLRLFFWAKPAAPAYDIRRAADAAIEQLRSTLEALSTDIDAEVARGWPAYLRREARRALDDITLSGR
jgi:hypothetical protein